MADETPETQDGNGLSRRDLLAKAGAVGAGAIAAGSLAGGAAAASKASFATPTPRRGGTLTFGLESDPVAMAPYGMAPGAAHWGKEHTYDSLAEFDRGLNIRPALAQSWKVEQERDHLHPPQGREVPQRQGADGGRRRLLRQEHEEPAAARLPDGRRERPGDDHGRSGPLEVSGAAGPVGAGRPGDRVLRLAALRAHRPRGALRPDQREPGGDRHRPVQAGQLHPARPRRAGAATSASGSPASRTWTGST